MRGFVCYLERAAGGAAIRRVRIVGPEVDHAWTAPSDDPGGGAAAAGALGGAMLGVLRSAARWIADQLEDVHELLAICVDTDGGVCSWLSAPSADPSVVAAALSQAPAFGGTLPSQDGGPQGAEGFAAAGVGMAGFGSDRSVQALAAAVTSGRSASILTLARKHPVPGAPTPRQRLAVLSVPDAPVRVFLDELDKLKIEVRSVVSLWHAAAAAWAPGEGGRARAASGAANGVHDRVVASSSPVTGVVLIDPLGRLVWAWSSEGELVAAGSMRLRTAPAPVAPAAAPLRPLGEGTELSLSDTGVRRLEARTEEPAPDKPSLECGVSEVGRLVVDWLAWSAQLGQSPERIICVGPATVPGTDPRGAVGPASLAEAVTLAWPGATVDLVVHEDPIGATLNRLRGGPGVPPASGKAGARDEAADVPADPRVELVELSRRPGRIDRRLYLWGALAILAAAGATAVLGWRINSGAARATEQAETVLASRAKILGEVEDVVPGITNRPEPQAQLLGTLAKLREQRSKLHPEPPVIQEVVRVLEAMQGLPNLQITEINISSLISAVKLNTPPEDLESGPSLLDKLTLPPGRAGVVWRGSHGRTIGTAPNQRREFNLQSSTWSTPEPRNGGKP